jgi:hypothetical protein
MEANNILDIPYKDEAKFSSKELNNQISSHIQTRQNFVFKPNF